MAQMQQLVPYVPMGPEKLLADALWKKHKNNEGRLEGRDAFAFFMESGLERVQLREIWELSLQYKAGEEPLTNGKKQHSMGLNQFYVALRLISIAQNQPRLKLSHETLNSSRGVELPLPKPWGANPELFMPPVDASARKDEENEEEIERIPKFKKGDIVIHTKRSTGLERRGKLVGVHLEDAVNGVYYTLLLDQGHELQTTSKNIRLASDPNGSTVSASAPAGPENPQPREANTPYVQGSSVPVQPTEVRPNSSYQTQSNEGAMATSFNGMNNGLNPANQHAKQNIAMTTNTDSNLDDDSSWAIPEDVLSKYKTLFPTIADKHTGYVVGQNAVKFFSKSGLSWDMLGALWSLADVDGDGQLNENEFCVAFHLAVSVGKKGRQLPKTLPACLYRIAAASQPNINQTQPPAKDETSELENTSLEQNMSLHTTQVVEEQSEKDVLGNLDEGICQNDLINESIPDEADERIPENLEKNKLMSQPDEETADEPLKNTEANIVGSLNSASETYIDPFASVQKIENENIEMLNNVVENVSNTEADVNGISKDSELMNSAEDLDESWGDFETADQKDSAEALDESWGDFETAENNNMPIENNNLNIGQNLETPTVTSGNKDDSFDNWGSFETAGVDVDKSVTSAIPLQMNNGTSANGIVAKESKKQNETEANNDIASWSNTVEEDISTKNTPITDLPTEDATDEDDNWGDFETAEVEEDSKPTDEIGIENMQSNLNVPSPLEPTENELPVDSDINHKDDNNLWDNFGAAKNTDVEDMNTEKTAGMTEESGNLSEKEDNDDEWGDFEVADHPGEMTQTIESAGTTENSVRILDASEDAAKGDNDNSWGNFEAGENPEMNVSARNEGSVTEHYDVNNDQINSSETGIKSEDSNEQVASNDVDTAPVTLTDGMKNPEGDITRKMNVEVVKNLINGENFLGVHEYLATLEKIGEHGSAEWEENERKWSEKTVVGSDPGLIYTLSQCKESLQERVDPYSTTEVLSPSERFTDICQVNNYEKKKAQLLELLTEANSPSSSDLHSLVTELEAMRGRAVKISSRCLDVASKEGSHNRFVEYWHRLFVQIQKENDMALKILQGIGEVLTDETHSDKLHAENVLQSSDLKCYIVNVAMMHSVGVLVYQSASLSLSESLQTPCNLFKATNDWIAGKDLLVDSLEKRGLLNKIRESTKLERGKPEISSTKYQTEDWKRDSAFNERCALSLMKLENALDESFTDDMQTVSFSGRQYKLPLLNLWLNRVDASVPL